jgi:RNA-splicing ligase RtcB
LAIVGETKVVTVRMAVLLAAPAVGVCVVVTPDVHYGYGVPVGCVIATDGTLAPAEAHREEL